MDPPCIWHQKGFVETTLENPKEKSLLKAQRFPAPLACVFQQEQVGWGPTISLTTIVPRNNYSSVPLQIVIYKEDRPPDDQNQGDGGAQIVANDHLDDLASSVLLHSFANGHLQRGRFSR